MNYINKKYLLTFTMVTLLNISLAAFLIHNSFGQTNKYVDQKTLSVEVVTQGGSPLQISVINIDNTAESYQGVNYVIQNVGLKKVGAYVLLHTDESGAGRSTIDFFQSFASGQTIQNSIFVERAI